MTTLEKIRAEIEQMETLITKFEALQIIDKYASEECDRDCEHCVYLECPKDDYQTDMDEAWKQAKLRKARKKAKRWKRKYLRLMEICKEIKSDPSTECNYCVHLSSGIEDFFCDECYHNFTYKNNFKPKTKGGE